MCEKVEVKFISRGEDTVRNSYLKFYVKYRKSLHVKEFLNDVKVRKRLGLRTKEFIFEWKEDDYTKGLELGRNCFALQNVYFTQAFLEPSLT